MTIKELKRGDFFTLKDITYPSDKQVWIKGEYDRSSKRYECTRFDDINEVRYFKGDKQIFTNLVF